MDLLNGLGRFQTSAPALAAALLLSLALGGCAPLWASPQHHPEDHRGGIVGGGFPLRSCSDRFRKPEFLPQRSKDRDGAKRQCRGRHQFLGLAQQFLLLHVPGTSIGKFFEGAAGDQFVDAPEVGDDLLADASVFPLHLDNLEILPLRSVFAGEGEASQ